MEVSILPRFNFFRYMSPQKSKFSLEKAVSNRALDSVILIPFDVFTRRLISIRIFYKQHNNIEIIFFELLLKTFFE